MTEFGNFPPILIPYIKDYRDIGLLFYKNATDIQRYVDRNQLFKWEDFPIPIECIHPYIKYKLIVGQYSEGYIAFITNNKIYTHLWIKIRNIACTINIGNEQFFNFCRPKCLEKLEKNKL